MAVVRNYTREDRLEDFLDACIDWRDGGEIGGVRVGPVFEEGVIDAIWAHEITDLVEMGLIGKWALKWPALTNMEKITLLDKVRESRAYKQGDATSEDNKSRIPEAPQILNEELVYRAIVEAVHVGDYKALASAIRRFPGSFAFSDLQDALDGTVHYYVIVKGIEYANLGPKLYEASLKYMKCADLLRAHGAPVKHQDENLCVEMVFLNSHWPSDGSEKAIGELMRNTVAAGQADFTNRFGSRGNVAGLMPLSAAIKMGNPDAVQVLLELESPLAPTLHDFGVKDIVVHARAFGLPGSEAVAALIVDKLMNDRLAEAGPEAKSAPATRGRRASL